MTDKHPYERDLETGGASAEGHRGRGPGKRRGGGFVEFLVILFLAFALVFGFVRPFVVEAFWIPSESMVPTLLVGDRVFVNKFIYRFHEPHRGDIVVFQSVEDEPGGGEGPSQYGGGGEDPGHARGFFAGSDEPPDLIKRVVALAGDEVSVRDGTLYVNGQPQDEPYTNHAGLPDNSFYGPTTVPEGHVFVMGDNRGNSRDSRFFGPVPIENIEGEAFVIFWPPTRVGFL